MLRTFFLSSLLFGSGFLVPVHAQSGTSRPAVITIPAAPIRGAVIQDMELVEEAMGKGISKAGEEGKEGEEKKPEIDKALMGKLQQVPLDRRPSTRLRIWSLPEPLPVDADPELELPEEPPKADSLEKPKAVKDLIGKKAPQNPFVTARWIVLNEKLKVAEEEAKEAHKKATEDLKKQKKEFDKKTKEIKGKRTAREVEIFQRHVTLGRWSELPALLEPFEEEGSRKIYETMLTRLAKVPNQGSSSLRPFWEKHTFDFEDILSLIELAPDEFKKEDYALLAPLMTACLSQGHDLEEWLQRLRDETAKPEEESRLTRRQAARLLSGLGHNLEMAEFLPTLDKAVEDDDREAMNLLARSLEAQFADKKDFDLLETAWETTLAALAPGEIEDEFKEEALKRAVSLAPKLQSARGDEWLVESFTTRPDRGMEVIATIGKEVSTGMVKSSRNPDQRLASIKLLRTAVNALLEKAPESAEGWSESLNLLADCWLREALHSYEYSKSTTSSSYSQRDAYGNIYWNSYDRSYRHSPVQPLSPGELLEIRPDGRWRELLHESVQPKYDTTVAELYLKVNEEKKAFPFIEQLAKTNPKKANDLAEEFLNVWIKNNDPNSSQNRANIYSYSFGYMNRASGIPLTRSKQERNLKDLAEWIGKLKGVEGIELESSLLLRAFTSSHSYAEVYRVETMEEVFGSLEDLEPKTLANMAQTMRSNLAGLWRSAEVQKNSKTNRKKKDIEAEVQRGYTMAQDVLGRALRAHPDSWQLKVARAAMMHDLNNYKNDIQKASDFSGNRQEALDLFGMAAASYAEGIEDLRTEEYDSDAYIRWFFAALGASDIDAVDQNTVLAQKEIIKIRDALEEIPGEAGEAHLGAFANKLFTHLGEVNAAVKNRYLEAGFDIVGEHPQAAAARKVYDYYQDLVTEIELLTLVDGNSNVGMQPFGVQVELRYTKHIERESGGFSKYLQNQANAVNRYYYNYGRPQENYRDKFEESLRTILSDQFEVMSVTFNKEEANSKATDSYGWRRTPYAYVLLKAKGPEVDRIPPLKIDLDFNDVTGYVVLPIASPVVPIDASMGGGDRPFGELQITQILDERKSDDGILSMEIKAQAKGLVPALDSILDIEPADFEVIGEPQDQGVAVVRFNEDQESVLSERLWVVEMRAKEGVHNPENFAFGAPKDEGTQALYQRYDDADLVKAEQEINLLASYGERDKSNWAWWLLVLLVIGGSVAYAYQSTRGPAPTSEARVDVPDDITPFTVISLLRQVRSAPNLADAQRNELDSTVQNIERFYFGQEAHGEQPDLPSIARQWARRA